MRLIDRLRASKSEQRYSLSDYAQFVDSYYTFNNVSYPFTQTLGQNATKTEQAARSFGALVKSNGVVYACVAFRASVFSEARFQFQRMRDGRPGDLFGTRELSILEKPWPNGTTGDLLVRMSVDTDLAGNFFAVRDGDHLYRLRPDWVEVVLDRPAEEYDAQVIGFMYHPGGQMSKRSQTFDVGEVVHWAPKPDPEACYRGMSPLQPILREVTTDSQMIVHKESFLDKGATPNMIIKADPSVSFENFKKFKEEFQDDHEGARNAYKTLFIAGAADATVVGSDFKQLDFANTQGKGETRIAAAFEIPPILVGLSEGLQSATYSNYASARRRYADATERPRWHSAAGALQAVVTPPSDARLWVDESDVAFLREDEKDAAEIKQIEAATMRQLVDGGFDPSTIVDAVVNGDWTRLVHTKLFSVQLQPPGSQMSTASKVVATTN